MSGNGTRLETIQDLLRDISSFLKSAKFVYDFSNVTILSEGHLRNIPLDWTQWIRANPIQHLKQVFESKKSAWTTTPPPPPSLIDLVEKGQDLRSRIQSFQEEDSCNPRPCPLPGVMLQKMTPKKIHEISVLAGHLGSLCRDQRISHVIDVGSGLGYLDQALSLIHGLQIVSVECHQGHCEKASRRHQNDPNIKQVQARIGKDNPDGLLRILDELPSGARAALVGLHCCGPLTPTMIDSFYDLDGLRLLSVVSCCYQKMEASSSSIHMSRFVRASPELTSHLCTPYALRLAGQESLDTWLGQSPEEHLEHMRTFGCRSVLQVYAKQNNLTLKKRKRRATLRSHSGSNGELIQNLINRYDLDDAVNAEKELLDLCDKHESSFKILEFLTGLQLFLQPMFEYFILLDRLLFLLENGFAKANLLELFDPKISPRNKLISCCRI